MRSRSMLLAAVLLATGATVATAQSSPKTVPPDAVQFLIDSAAGDIHAHHHPDGKVQFRHARMGTTRPVEGTSYHLICGEYAVVPQSGKPTWVPFVTIKMITYEQWLGAEATSRWCKKVTWDPRTDITGALQAKSDSL